MFLPGGFIWWFYLAGECNVRDGWSYKRVCGEVVERVSGNPTILAEKYNGTQPEVHQRGKNTTVRQVAKYRSSAGESEESMVHRWQSMQVRRSFPWKVFRKTGWYPNINDELIQVWSLILLNLEARFEGILTLTFFPDCRCRGSWRRCLE